MRALRWSAARWIGAAVCLAGARADERANVPRVRSFLQSNDAAERDRIAAEILGDDAYDRAQVGGWLREAAAFSAFPAGRHEIRAQVNDGSTVTVVLRIPSGYEPTRAWPLIYALHGTGGSADDIIGYVERILGAEVESFIISAPDGYQQFMIDGPTPPSDEHAACLLAVRKTAPVDSDRVYAVGYSRGGHACWALAVLNADAFAGIVPVAGSLLLPGSERLWETFLPSIGSTRMLNCWGARDTGGPGADVPATDGGIAGLNRRLAKAAERLKLPVISFEDPQRGHGGIVPPSEELAHLLAARRPAQPAAVRIACRAIDQAHAYWLEAARWKGPQWDARPMTITLPPEKAADPAVAAEALASAVRGKLGELSGEVAGQTISVKRRNLDDITVWIGEGMIDWERPVTVTVMGNRVFEGSLRPNLRLCLSQAARTYDFQRLRWAGLRCRAGSKAVELDGREQSR